MIKPARSWETDAACRDVESAIRYVALGKEILCPAQIEATVGLGVLSQVDHWPLNTMDDFITDSQYDD